MTCIVALKQSGSVYMSADSAGVAGYVMTVRKDPKIYRVGEFLIGFTSSFRMGQLLGHQLEVPAQKGMPVDKFMSIVFIDAVRDCLKKGGFLLKSGEQESGGEFLVGYRGRLFKVCSDFQVGETVLPFDACGCGQDAALGSLYSTAGKKPDERLKLAMRAAERFSAGVRAPFITKTLSQ